MRSDISRVALLLALAPAFSVAWAPDGWTRIGPGGGGAQYIPTISPHDPNTVLVRCDMTGAYLSRNGGDTWGMFNLGGAARFFVFDPLDARTMYTESLGLWRSTDSGQTWNLLFPSPADIAAVETPSDHAEGRILTKAGRYPHVAALAIDPADSKSLYAAVSEGNAMTLSISADGGKSWKESADLPSGVLRLYIDPASPAGDRTITAVTAKSLMVRSGGAWKEHPAPAQFIDISAGYQTPAGHLRLYGVSRDSLHISDDGGGTWRSSEIQPGAKPRLSAIATSAQHTEVAYAAFGNLDGRHFGVAKTTDAGLHWTMVWKETSAEPAANLHDGWISERLGSSWGGTPLSLGVAPTDPNIVYATDLGRTMRSTDGGKNWSGVYSRKGSDDGVTSSGMDVTTAYGVHFDPFNQKRQFITYTDIGLFRSENGGESWISSTVGVPRPWRNTTYWVEFDPAVDGRMWAVASGTHDLPRPKMWRQRGVANYNGGVAISDDGGRTWRQASATLPQTAATHILLDPTSPKDARVLYMTGFGRGVFKSTDSGATWTLKNEGIEGTEPFAWRLARDARGTLYVVVARRSENGSFGNAGDGALYRSSDGAEHWEKLPLPEELNGPNGLAIDPKEPNRLYLAAWGREVGKEAREGGIFLSTDGGKKWRHVLSQDQHIYDVTIDPRDAKLLYAAGFESSAWRSSDRGETWKRIAGYDFKWGHRVIADPNDAGKIYVTTFGGSVWHGPADQLKTPGAGTWQVRTNDAPVR